MKSLLTKILVLTALIMSVEMVDKIAIAALKSYYSSSIFNERAVNNENYKHGDDRGNPLKNRK